MRVTGSATVEAPRERVFDALCDPRVLVRAIPGCERLETIAPNTYRMTVSAGVAAIKGTYQGRVALSEPQPPSSFTLRAQGQGAPGTVDATVRVRLAGEGEHTRVDYEADAVVGGMVGGVGQRMLAGVAKRTAGEFFTAVGRELAADVPAPVPPGTASTAPASGAADGGVADLTPGTAAPVSTRSTPPATRPAAGADTRLVLTGFALGAAVALGGTLVGAAISRAAYRSGRS